MTTEVPFLATDGPILTETNEGRTDEANKELVEILRGDAKKLKDLDTTDEKGSEEVKDKPEGPRKFNGPYECTENGKLIFDRLVSGLWPTS